MKVLRKTKNPSEPTGEATELVTRYFRKPKYAKGRAWLEEHLGQQRLFQYNPSIVSVQSIGSGKYGVFVMNQLVKKGTKAVCNAYAKTLKSKEVKRNPDDEILELLQTNEVPTQFHNFDNDTHDVIFADDSDDVIFADDEMLTEGLSNEQIARIIAKQNPFGIGEAIKRRVNRYRAGRAYKQSLKHQARADRAQARQSEFEKLSIRNPNGFFDDCLSLDEVKSKYKKLAREFHPDLGGDVRLMQELNAAYDKAVNQNIWGSTENEKEANSLLREAIEFAVTLDGVNANIRGLWLWLEGNTFPIKERIKAFQSSNGIGFKWANKKKAWFYAAVPSANRRGEMSFDEIEKLYGKESVSVRGSYKLNPGIFEEAYILSQSGYNLNDIAEFFGVGRNELAEEISVSNEQFANNPAWLTNATNALVGLASAAQLREHLQKHSRRKVIKKPTKRRAKKNPHGGIFEEFTGRQATTTTEMPVSHLAPVKLDKLGDLVEIHLTDGRKLEFNPNSRTHQVWLCAANKRQMWITGTTIAKPNPDLKDHEIEPVGEIDKIVYHEFKPVVGDDKPEFYIHELGEWSGNKPILAADKNGFPVIYGGNYSIESRGIVD